MTERATAGLVEPNPWLFATVLPAGGLGVLFDRDGVGCNLNWK